MVVTSVAIVAVLDGQREAMLLEGSRCSRIQHHHGGQVIGGSSATGIALLPSRRWWRWWREVMAVWVEVVGRIALVRRVFNDQTGRRRIGRSRP